MCIVTYIYEWDLQYIANSNALFLHQLDAYDLLSKEPPTTIMADNQCRELLGSCPVHTHCYHTHTSTVLYIVYTTYMTFIIHEMLRKTRHGEAGQGNTTQQKDKATQLTQSSYFLKEKVTAASGGTRTHDPQILGNALTN